MLSGLKKLFRGGSKTEAELREDGESKRRGQQEWRAAEMRKSDDQRGSEGFGFAEVWAMDEAQFFTAVQRGHDVCDLVGFARRQVREGHP